MKFIFGKSSSQRKAARKAANHISELGVRNAEAQVKLVKNLARIRRSHGLTLEEVAHKMGVDTKEVRRFEMGGSNFKMSTARKYAKAVNALLLLDATPYNQLMWPSSSSTIFKSVIRKDLPKAELFPTSQPEGTFLFSYEDRKELSFSGN